MAEAIGTTKATVSRMESGSREPNLGYLAAVAEVAGCLTADLFRRPTGQEPLAQGAAGHAFDASDDEIRLALRLIRTIRKRD